MKSIESINRVYSAFIQRDIPALLEELAEDVVWEYAPTSARVPWLAPRKGKIEAVGAFEAMEQIEITKFEINDIIGNENVVVVLINIDFTVKSTGKKVVERDEPHVWRFNKDGKIRSFRHASDTYAHWKALGN